MTLSKKKRKKYEVINAMAQKRIAKQRSILRFLMQQTYGHCFYCNKILSLRKQGLNKATVDHYIPLAKGGMDIDYNKVASCPPCNNEKDDLMPEDFRHGNWENKKRQIERTGYIDPNNPLGK